MAGETLVQQVVLWPLHTPNTNSKLKCGAKEIPQWISAIAELDLAMQTKLALNSERYTYLYFCLPGC